MEPLFLLTKCEEPRPRAFLFRGASRNQASIFQWKWQDWFEPSFGIMSVTDGTAFSVGHLFAATVYNGGPAPNIFSSWICNYIIDGMNLLKEEVPQELSGSIFEDLYKQVCVENYVVVVSF